ncbi:IniB N-terminal domain-containing protein [Virgisporangium aurantiacum]|uniref:Uncharacterized protein n=1 Tax=Virgisporangium aurantiacum TaxID=175570 RepID=A0A8J3ZAL6_9ACTN|nr:IniB N-terminal domain-containing protein [Virgisporangium aurantiacum]GIJ60436.1 hypothetical protein Vau01_079520 [Virgisporangium aurantiacum]
MEIQTTLHDFVLKLLVEPGARAEFELDPEGALADAGLGDITAADVQDVIPLVVDYAPVDGVTGLVDTDALVGGLGSDPTSAVSQLQGFTQQLPIGTGSGTGTDLNLGATAVAGVSLDLGQLEVSPVTLPGLGFGPGGPAGLAGVPSQLSAIGDPAGTIDGLDPIGSAVGGPVLGGTGPAGLDGLTGTVGGVTGQLGGVVGSVGGVADPVNGVVDSTVTGVVGAADVSVGTLTGVTGALGSPGLTGSVTGTHSADLGLTDPTGAGHTGSDLPTIGHSPVDGLVGDVTHGVTDHLPLI